MRACVRRGGGGQVVIGVRNAGASTIDQQLLFVGQEQGKLQVGTNTHAVCESPASQAVCLVIVH